MKKETTNLIKLNNITIIATIAEIGYDENTKNLNSSPSTNERVTLEVCHPILTDILIKLRPQRTSSSGSNSTVTDVNNFSSNGAGPQNTEVIGPPTPQQIRHIRPADLESSEVQKLLNQLLMEYFTHTRENSYRPSKRGFCEIFCQRKKNIIIRYTSMRLNQTFQELWQKSILLETETYDEY